MKLIPLADLGYTVFKTTKGYAIGLTLEEADSQDELHQHPTRESAENALEWSFSEEEAA